MELRTLRYFLAVAQEQNMTAAAALLNVSQPALSYQISELEKELGVQLFERTSRKMRLSEDGMRLRARAEEIIALADRAKVELTQDSGEVYGDIYIGAAESISLHFLAEIIAGFRRDYPHVVFHFISGNLDDVGDKLSMGSVDFAVAVEPFAMDGCEIIPLPSRDRMGIVVPRSHPLAKKKAVRAADLYDIPLIITLRRSMTLQGYAEMLNIPAERLNIAATGNLIFNMAILAEHDVGVIVTLAGLVASHDGSQLQFVPLVPEIKRKLVFAWKQHRPLTKAARLFLERARSSFEGVIE